MRYLGIKPRRPRIGVFDFTGCEGCELQLANKESTLPAFLDAIEVVSFREISSDQGDSYDFALIEGAITREDEVERIRAIRNRAAVVVALGSCACFGGVNRMKNAFDLEDANRKVYGENPKETLPTRSIGEVVKVDLQIPGCPISKDEVERIVQHLVLDVPYSTPKFPVCVECKQRFTSCVFDAGEVCLGPITRAGCGAPCPAAGVGCYGCRGPSAEPNYEEFLNVASERGFADIDVRERMDFFGGFEGLR
jgi:coenzyme F420-reducing hydrogenase gamma subunit